MKPTEWGYGVQTSHLFPLVNHLENLHLGYSAIDTNKINKGKGIIVKEIKAMMH
jgi:hypothetical protein